MTENENNESVIDLTNCSYTLADHCRLDNVIINLDTDDSFREDVNYQSANPTSVGRVRKRRHTKTRSSIEARSTVQDLCTPETKNRRRSRNSKKVSENATITEESTGEPKVKKAKKHNASCPICFEEFCGQPLCSTKCGHVFCQQCLKLALKRESRCPTCRTALKGSSKYHPIFL